MNIQSLFGKTYPRGNIRNLSRVIKGRSPLNTWISGIRHSGTARGVKPLEMEHLANGSSVGY